MSRTQPPLIERMRPFGTTIFAEMTALARTFDAVNLGQGFPDADPPAELRRLAQQAIESGPANQYAPASGFPELREAIAAHQSRWYGVDLDPEREIMVTAGATEALTTTIQALCEPGDEVVLLAPFYDSYPAAIALAGARHRSVETQFPDYQLDEDALRAACHQGTRMIVVNNPQNPTGKVFSRAELDAIGRVAIEFDAYIVVDEVYEHLVFHDQPHTPIASLPGLAERTLTISSGGKTFSATGWKVGWVSGPASLIDAIRTVKQFVTFTTSGPFQLAIAAGLNFPDSYFHDAAANQQRRCDLVATALADLGFHVAPPQAGYFVVADAAPLGVTDAAQWCRELPQRAGVAAIPVSAFHDPGTPAARTLVRFACCKSEAVLREGLRRLAAA